MLHHAGTCWILRYLQILNGFLFPRWRWAMLRNIYRSFYCFVGGSYIGLHLCSWGSFVYRAHSSASALIVSSEIKVWEYLDYILSSDISRTRLSFCAKLKDSWRRFNIIVWLLPVDTVHHILYSKTTFQKWALFASSGDWVTRNSYYGGFIARASLNPGWKVIEALFPHTTLLSK